MTAILGITAFHAGASACLVIEGVPVFAIAEERINRVKYYGGFPTQSIQACLDFAGLKLSDIDHVAVGRDPQANRMQKAKFALANIGRLSTILAMKKKMDTFGGIKEVLADAFETDPAGLTFQVHNVEHHIAHTASSYFVSPWEKCAGLSIDGSGDFVSTTIADCEGDQIKLLDKTYLPDSLGNFYSMICEFIGYDRYGDEGKVMGLAPYGQDAYSDLFEDMIHLFNGKQVENHYASDISLVLEPLPKMPILICYWKPEDGMESDLNVFFDSAAEANLSIESIYTLGAGLVIMFEKLALRHGLQ